MEESDKKPASPGDPVDAPGATHEPGDESVAAVPEADATAADENTSAAAAAGLDEPVVAEADPAPSSTMAVPTLAAAPARKSGAAVLLALVALLLALAAAVASGWMLYQSQVVPPSAAGADDLGRLQLDIEALQASAAAQQRQLDNKLAGQQQGVQGLQQRIAEYDQRLAALQEGQNSQRERLLAYATTDRSDWMLAEAEYLLRLANQRIIMAADVRSAKALLQSADQILLELDSADLMAVRAAIAADLAALRAVPAVDVEGTWLRLQALVGQIDALRLFEVPQGQPQTTGPAPSGDWQQRLQHGIAAALAKLSRYIVINRRDTPYEPMMGPQWEQLVRQNLRMLLEQSRAALLSGNQQLYEQSLSNSRFWLAEFFNQDTAGVAALDAELAALAAVTVTRNYPDISASMMAVKTVINTRHLAAGGN